MQVGDSITSLECSKDAGILDRIRSLEVADLEGHLHGSPFVSTKLNPNLPRGDHTFVRCQATFLGKFEKGVLCNSIFDTKMNGQVP